MLTRTHDNPPEAHPKSIAETCEELRLLATDSRKVTRVPFLVRGRLIVPEDVSIAAIERAFAERDEKCGLGRGPAPYAVVGRTQILRERIVDRERMEPTGEYAYRLMPAFSPEDVIEADVQDLAREVYTLSFDEVETFIRALQRTLEDSSDLLEALSAATLATAELPEFWHRAAFASLPRLLDADALRAAVDRELSTWGVPGTKLLDGWVELEAEIFPGESNLLAASLFEEARWAPPPAALRAMPTRQLHITAGNAPQIPLISLLRAFATKSPSVIKSPSGAILPGALMALAIAQAMPDHPLARHTSIVYWPGGHDAVEAQMFRPGAFDRIVVWGDPQSVAAVKTRALASKVLTFNPRYAVSFIGREAFAGRDLTAVAVKSVTDSLIANQKACIASLVHYVEGSDLEAKAYAEAVSRVLADFDRAAPNYLPPSVRGELKRLMRGTFLDAEWIGSGVVMIDHEFPIMRHPMSRLIVVRRVERLEDALAHLHPGVSTVGVFPPARRRALRDRIAAAGVSNTVELGESGRAYAGMSHDGMIVLSELVDWKNG
jgi:acyl-CoA reductase LuxC